MAHRHFYSKYGDFLLLHAKNQLCLLFLKMFDRKKDIIQNAFMDHIQYVVYYTLLSISMFVFNKIFQSNKHRPEYSLRKYLWKKLL